MVPDPKLRSLLDIQSSELIGASSQSRDGQGEVQEACGNLRGRGIHRNCLCNPKLGGQITGK